MQTTSLVSQPIVKKKLHSSFPTPRRDELHVVPLIAAQPPRLTSQLDDQQYYNNAQECLQLQEPCLCTRTNVLVMLNIAQKVQVQHTRSIRWHRCRRYDSHHVHSDHTTTAS